MNNYFSLLPDPPPGFTCQIPDKRDLLANYIALYVQALNDALNLLPDFQNRVRGIVISPGTTFSHKQLSNQLWYFLVPPNHIPQLGPYLDFSLEILKKGTQLHEENMVRIADMTYNGQLLAKTRDGYNKALERLQQKMQEASYENERRRKAIARLNEEIQARKKARREQSKLEHRLHQAQKMETIGLMAGGVAHDLNNILAGVVGYPDLLLLSLPEESNLRQPLEKIKESGKRAAEVVTDLLTIAGSSANPFEIANLNSILQQYFDSLELKELKSRYPKVTIQFDLDNNLANISCSPSHIRKCLMNLVTNSFEAIGKEGVLKINCSNRTLVQEKKYGDSTLRRGNYVVLCIEDSGKGIDKKHLPHIFEPFYSRKKMGYAGTGLGLTVVWNTVQEHDGAIHVESGSKGTRFELFFPVSNRSMLQSSDNHSYEELRGNQQTVMVVDDEEILLDIAENMLSKLNYMPVTMLSGEEAIHWLKDNEADLIILDMVMNPWINGRQTYEKILTFRPEQRAIIASGFAENNDTREVIKLGAANFLRKPYTLHALAKAVKEALAK